MARSRPASVHEEKITGRIFDWKVYRRLYPFARPYRNRFVVSVFILLMLAGLAVVTPLAMRYVMDNAIAPRIDTTPDQRVALIGQVALILVGTGIVTFFLRYSHLYLTNVTGQRIIFDIRRNVFGHIQRRNLRFFDTNPVGKLVTRVTSDVETLAELFSAGVDVIFYDLVMIAVILGVLFWVNASLAIWTLALIPLVAIWSFVFKRQAQGLFRTVRAKVSQLNSFINECVTGIRVIQIFGTERGTRRTFRRWNRELRESHMGTVKNFSLFFPGIEISSSLGAAIIIVVGHRLVTQQELTPGDMLMFWFLLHRFFEPLRQISEKFNLLQSAMASSERILNIIDADQTIKNPDNPKPIALDGRSPSIRFDDVSFSYDGRTEVLTNVDFEVRPGETLAIVGATGAGKTSIINVLSRFYDVQKGSISINGTDIRDVDKFELRRSVGVVLQDVFLFADTIRENLRLGDESTSDEALLEACRTVFADRLIGRVEGGLDHEVAERGATFSMGERQLLAFARTLVHDPPVIVLDEATSNIDTETETLIQQALERMMSGRTVIVIAHRLSTIKKADRILVMHHGEVRETGAHAELLKKNGIYRKLYDLQYATRATG